MPASRTLPTPHSLQDQVQGPCPASDMNNWFLGGHLPADLMICGTVSGQSWLHAADLLLSWCFLSSRPLIRIQSPPPIVPVNHRRSEFPRQT